MNINDMLGNEPVMQDRSPKGQIFSIEAEIKNLMQEYDMVVQDKNSQGAFGSNKRAQMIADKIDQLQQQKIGIQSQMGDENMTDAMRYFFKTDPPGFDRDRLSRIEIERTAELKKQREGWKKRKYETIPELAGGGEAIDDELEGMEMTEEQAMAEVGVAEKEMQMIQQLVAVVQQLIAEGLGEKDIVAFLKEQGLDDEDIDSLMQMVLQAQSGQAPEGIDQQLQGMM